MLVWIGIKTDNFVVQVVSLPVGETGVDICAAENFSFVLTDAGNVFGFGSEEKSSRFEFLLMK